MLDFLSIDVGTILFTLINTAILFLGLKHFLFRPVNAVLEQRQQIIDSSLQEAEEARASAEAAKTEYAEKLAASKEESAEMLRKAAGQAQRRADAIVAEARADAAAVLRQNAEELEQEKRRAARVLRDEVSALAVLAAEKVISREINPDDHARLIDEFIDGLVGAE